MNEVIVIKIDKSSSLLITFPFLKHIESVSELKHYIQEKKYLSVVSSFHTPRQKLLSTIKEILGMSEIDGIICSIPSTLSSFSLETKNLFFIELETEKGWERHDYHMGEITCNVEIIVDMKLDIPSSKKYSGSFEEVANSVFNLLARHEHAKILGSNIHVYCKFQATKELFQELLAMNVCKNTKNIKQISHVKFLKLRDYVKTSPQIPEDISEDPVFIGAWLSSKIRFYETRDFSTKREFYSGEYKELTIH